MSRAEQARLPDFLVIGVHKAGTTALYHALGRHPDIFMSPIKEPRFFTFEGESPRFRGPGERVARLQFVTDLDKYKDLFRGAASNQIAGEASPIYTSWYRTERTAENIRRHVPTAKLVAVIRQPAARAWSEYHYQRQLGNEPCATFQEALEVEAVPERADWFPDQFYFRTGLYAGILKQYYRLFPREQLHIVLYEEWKDNPTDTLRDLYRFSGGRVRTRPGRGRTAQSDVALAQSYAREDGPRARSREERRRTTVTPFCSKQGGEPPHPVQPCEPEIDRSAYATSTDGALPGRHLGATRAHRPRPVALAPLKTLTCSASG